MLHNISTLIELLRWKALHQPSELLYTFLDDEGGEAFNLTYNQLDHKARTIAALLQDSVATGARALLLYPPGLEFAEGFFGCLYAGVIAVPAYPPDPSRLNRTLPRLRAIVEDAKPTVVISTAKVLAMVKHLFAHAPELQDLTWFAADMTPDAGEGDWKDPGANSGTVAFLQYTSGSTDTPKGVILTHANLLHNASLIYNALEYVPGDKYVSWLPTFHDMGFMAGVLQPLYAGIPAILMSPISFLKCPMKWLGAISAYKATISGGPNFAYDLCVRKISPEQRSSLDLSSWNVTFNGSEPIRTETLERFVKAFEPCGFRREAFYPCYGLAESTLIVSGGKKNAPPITKSFDAKALEDNQVVQSFDGSGNSRSLVSCGRALLDQKIIIAHPDTLARCMPKEVGEILVSSPSVAKGYWNRLEEIQESFNAHLADTGEGPFLRTGDLGFIDDGELFITGRLKDLIIIRGLNHYPQDIEWTVERCHAALRPGCGAAISVELDGEERLVIIQEIDNHQHFDLQEIIRNIRKNVAEFHELQAYVVALIKPGSIPKTSSGKIQRNACRNVFLNGNLELLAEWQPSALSSRDTDDLTPAILTKDAQSIRTWLASQVAARTGVNSSEIDIERVIIEYGLDSLMAIELEHRIERESGVSLPLTSLFQTLSIAEVATQIQTGMVAAACIPENSLAQAQEGSDATALSFGQQAIWFLHQLSPDSPAYNIASAVRIQTDLDLLALRGAFQAIIDRHACLRTTFTTIDGQPARRVHKHMEVCFNHEDVSILGEAYINRRLVETAYHPFNLEEGPLLRVNVFNRSPNEHILLLVVHHIAADFWSLAILVRELGILYQAKKKGRVAVLTSPSWQYDNYVRWQRDMLAGSEEERLWAYWKGQLDGDLPALDLPLDKPRPPVQTYRGAAESFKLNASVTGELKLLANNHRATLYVTLLAIFQVLLHRYTDQECILVGSPTTGRVRAELADLIGYLVNPVILRADFSDCPTFEKFLGSVRQTVVEALKHQDYPFARLVERLQPTRDAARSPLFQVMFVLQRLPLPNGQSLEAFALGEAGIKKDVGGLIMETLALQQCVAQFDLMLMVAEVDGELRASLQYNVDLFNAPSMARMVSHFQRLAESIVNEPAQRISDVPLLTEPERNQLVFEWNYTHVDYPAHLCIHQLFEAQVERTPLACAVICDEEQVTYGELNRKANQLAHYLRSFGVGPEARVGICLERSIDMIAGIFGVLKAGGTYVPLDPNYPGERLALMLKDAQVKVLLSQPHIAAGLPDYQVQVVTLDAHAQAIATQREQNPSYKVAADNLAYIIYTSGSTGMPKGVAIEHHSTVAMLHWARELFSSRDLEGVLGSTSICFDLSVFEVFVPLSWGGTIILVESALHLMTSPAARGVTLINTVPSAIAELLRANAIPATVHTINLAGEPLQSRLAQQVYEQNGRSRLLNLYGPSEDTTYSTYAVVEMGGSKRPTIGRPIFNTQIYLLDRQKQPVPVGIPGEVHIGGDGLARGYLDRPELTAEKFIPNAFSTVPGKRLYTTGDFARYLPDGSIDFLGRMDYQAKVRGYRIEMGEIESVLEQHPAVRQAIVIVREEGDCDRRLVAYFTIRRQQALMPDELEDFLKDRLPGYMIPYAFVLLDQFPLAANGKVNRRALPAPDRISSELERTFLAPRTDSERALASIWAEVLGTDHIGVNDNFFRLGGHSLLAVRVLSRIRERCRVDLPLHTLFEEPTIAGLAEAIESTCKQKGPGPQPPPMIRIPRQAHRVTISSRGVLADSEVVDKE